MEIVDYLLGRLARDGNSGSTECVRLIDSVAIRVGGNILTDDMVTPGAGWTGSLAEGFTHAKDYTEPLRFAIGSADGDAYFIQGGCPHTGGTLIELSVGQSAPSDPYNGTTSIAWGVQSVGGGDLVITPKSDFVGTLTNLTCKKVDENGTEEIVVTLDDIAHDPAASHISGMWNVQIGNDALESLVNGTRNVAIGRRALRSLVTGGRNIALGTFTLPAAKYAEGNVNIGADSGLLVQTADHNVAMGKASLYEAANASKNVAVGAYSLNSRNMVDSDGKPTGTPSENVAIGYHAAFNGALVQQWNVAIGMEALFGSGVATTAEQSGNVAIGYRAGYKNGSKNNVFIGKEAGQNNPSNMNTFVGSGAGKACATTCNTIIGANAEVPSGFSRCQVFGYNAKATKNNQAVLGAAPGTTGGIEETVLMGDLINVGKDGVKRRILFEEETDANGNVIRTCRWEEA